MAEDQAYNGDAWNKEASILLKKFNWEQIGDSNIDVINDEGKSTGLDRVFKIFDLNRKGNAEIVVVEAKRYQTTSFNKSKISEWIKVLDGKLNKVRGSSEFRQTYGIDGIQMRIGLIVIWFPDVDTFITPAFQKTYLESLLNYKASSYSRKAGSNRIYILTNDIILRLCSMSHHIDEFQRKQNVTLRYFYPGSTDGNRPVSRNDQLTVDYFLSKFILLESSVASSTTYNVVFYFGQVNLASFKRLSSALYTLKFVDEDKELVIYHYENNDEFRKVKPEIEKLFPKINFQLKKMTQLRTLPAELDTDHD
jgi:hypothetical protein